MVATATVRVRALRFTGNGAIFSGSMLGPDWSETRESIVCVFPSGMEAEKPAVGDVWEVRGRTETYKGEPQIRCTDAVRCRPSGNNFVSFIAAGARFQGIGPVTAQRLWDALGERVYEVLDGRQVEELRDLLPRDLSNSLLDEWAALGLGNVVRWLDRHGLSRKLGRKILAVYGASADQTLDADPYRLLAFGTSWREIDRISRTRFGIAEADPRRLHAAATEALYRQLDAHNTAADAETLLRGVTTLLGGNDGLARTALNHTYADGGFVEYRGLFQARGAHLMERWLADFFESRRAVPTQTDWLADATAVDRAVADFEAREHELAPEQVHAVRQSLERPLSLILGGAGVGKTSVLKALHTCLDATHGRALQMALSGRAAKRMTEATGRPAMTIAGFLLHLSEHDVSAYSHVIIDEASMLDVVLAYRIGRRLPDGVKLVLVGDPFQLPPIGPGLILHLLAASPAVHSVTLTRVYRQTGESGIPTVSKSLRDGVWPRLPRYAGPDVGVSFRAATEDDMEACIAGVYDELGTATDGGDVQILCATKAERAWGTAGINRALHDVYGTGPEVIGEEDGQPYDTGIAVGDPVIFTRNDWEREIFNGSLGRVVAVPAAPQSGGAVCEVDFEGRVIPLTNDDLDSLDLAYAITVHKAQGSQFRRVIIPVRRSRLLDRTLIYTAVTRGVEQVVLVGDEAAARAAVEAPPAAHERTTGLRTMLAGSRTEAEAR
jgi:exodeoxyribonuclease V alpha subunit